MTSDGCGQRGFRGERTFKQTPEEREGGSPGENWGEWLRGWGREHTSPRDQSPAGKPRRSFGPQPSGKPLPVFSVHCQGPLHLTSSHCPARVCPRAGVFYSRNGPGSGLVARTDDLQPSVLPPSPWLSVKAQEPNRPSPALPPRCGNPKSPEPEPA